MAANSTSPMMILGKDINGYITYSLPFSRYNYNATLSAGVDTTLTIPNDYNIWTIVFGIPPGAEIWVAVNQIANVPAGASFVLTNSVLNPTVRNTVRGDVIHFYSTLSVNVGVSLYAVQ